MTSLLTSIAQLLLESLDLLVCEPVQIDQSGASTVGVAKQFVQLEPNRPCAGELQDFVLKCGASNSGAGRLAPTAFSIPVLVPALGLLEAAHSRARKD
jgi:hypothetical protein